MTVEHGVAVGAHWAEVGVRVNDVFPLHGGQRDKVVHMDETLAEVSVDGPEVESAHRAPDAVPLYTGLAGSRIALVGVHENPRGSPLHTAPRSENLFSDDG